MSLAHVHDHRPLLDEDKDEDKDKDKNKDKDRKSSKKNGLMYTGLSSLC